MTTPVSIVRFVQNMGFLRESSQGYGEKKPDSVLQALDICFIFQFRDAMDNDDKDVWQSNVIFLLHCCPQDVLHL